MRSRAAVTVMGMALGSGGVLSAGVPHFGDLARHLATPHRWVAAAGADAAVAALAGALLWLVAVWVALGLLLTAGSLLPGQVGRTAHALAYRLTPAALRRAMVTVTGASILLSPATALAAPGSGAPATAPSATQPAMRAVGWPTDPSPSVAPASLGSASDVPAATPAPSPTTPAPSPAGPSTTAPRTVPSTVAPPRARPHPNSASPYHSTRPDRPIPDRPASQVTVHPGDSLWTIATRQLGRTATAARVAQAWPRWYAANRLAIGSDPDLIQPGTRLAAPRPAESGPGA